MISHFLELKIINNEWTRKEIYYFINYLILKINDFIDFIIFNGSYGNYRPIELSTSGKWFFWNFADVYFI